MKSTYAILMVVLTLLLAIGTASAVVIPSCDFTGGPTTGQHPLTVNFTASYSGITPPVTYEWDFGDNSGALKISGPTITHVYQNPGKYDVRLAVNDLGVPTTWWVSNTKEDYITVTNIPPQADFTFTSDHPQAAPLDVQFTSTTTGTPYTLSWDFGDGNMAGDVDTPMHTYSEAGTYTINLTATNDGGSTSAIDTITVLPPKPHSAFTASPTSGKYPLAVNFVDLSTGEGINEWAWTFGDGGTSTSQNPLYAYAHVGLYEVRLTVTSPSGSSVHHISNFINVTAEGIVCPVITIPPTVTPPASHIGVFKDSNWYLDSNGDGSYNSGDTRVIFGAPGENWKPIYGDWNGDGKSEIGVYKDGKWYLDYNGNGLFDDADKTYIFGLAGWEPVVGDWNKDTKVEVGVYKDGAWYLDYDGSGSFTGGDRVYNFGLPTWIPIVGNWDSS